MSAAEVIGFDLKDKDGFRRNPAIGTIAGRDIAEFREGGDQRRSAVQ
jgi:hypothetical protein